MRKIFMCNEMEKLRKQLDKRNIPWEDKSTICPEEHIALQIRFGVEPNYADTTVYRTHFSYKNTSFSVVNGYGTYGGYDPDEGKNKGLLEVAAGTEGEIKGWLTAEQVMDLIGA